MKKATIISLLFAGVVLSLAGCQKGSDHGGQPVTFTATSANPYTRTAYSGQMDGAFERINWLEGDEITVWSDFAVDANNSSSKVAKYQITGIENSGRNSKASLKNAPGKNGLVYVDGKDSYKFWSVYPTVTGTPSGASLNYTIPAAQKMASGVEAVVNGNATTFPVDMSNAYMLAATEGAEAEKPVTMYFYPAFTAFEFTLTAEEGAITVTKVELISDSGLAGNVVATLVPGTRTNTVAGVDHTIGASTYACTAAADNLAYTLPAGTSVTPESTVTFTLLAMPQNIEGLKVKFHVTIEGEETFFVGTLKKDGQPITFGACEKFRIKGVAVPGNRWKIFYQPAILEADEWIEVEVGEETPLIVE